MLSQSSISGTSISAPYSSATSTSDATTVLVGVAAQAAAGAISAAAASGTTAAILGVAVSTQAGPIAATANSNAAAMLIGVAAQFSAGQINTVIVNGDVIVTLLGVAAIARAGSTAAVGTRAGVMLNITEDMVCKVVREYIMSLAPALRVVRTPVNKASRPEGAYVSFTPGARVALATNADDYSDNGRFVKRSDQMGFQIDCYGDGSADRAELLNMLYRDKYAADMFAESGFDIAPLYAGNIMQAPFVNDADQYEERYTFQIELQLNSVIELPQQSCNMLDIDLVSIDANYPPQEVE